MSGVLLYYACACVCVSILVLVIQHAIRMRRIILSCGLFGCTIFFHITQSPMVTIRTTYCNIKKLGILLTQCVYETHIILTIYSDNFVIQY